MANCTAPLQHLLSATDIVLCVHASHVNTKTAIHVSNPLQFSSMYTTLNGAEK